MIADALVSAFTRGHVIGDGDGHFITGGSTAAGERVNPDSALSVPAFYGAVSIIASGVRGMSLRVVRDRGDGVMAPERDSRLWELLHDRPNRYMHAADLWEWKTLCMLLRGNAFAWIAREPSGRVRALEPLSPTRVEVGRDTRTREKIFVVRPPDSRESVDFVGSTEDILHVKGFGTDPLVGVSVIHHLRETVGRALSEDRRAASMMRNNGRPSGILKVPNRLSDDAATRLKEQWQAAHGGRKSGGTAVLQEDVDWQKVEMTAADMELVKQRAISREDFAIALQIPGDMLLAGSQAGLHYSSDATRDVRLVKHAVMPWAQRIQNALEICDLLPWGQVGSSSVRLLPRFNPAALLKTDLKTRYEAHKVGIEGGFLTPNEARRIEDLEPLPGLDRTKPQIESPPKENR